MNKLRLTVQAVFIGFAAYLGYRHQVFGGGPAGVPPLDAYCPFGALETFPLYFTTGDFLQKTAPSNFWLIAAVIVISLLGGALFCGWICPLGGLADAIYKARRKIYKRKVQIDPRLAVILSYGRFLMLGGILYFSWWLKKLWFEEYDPYKAIFHMNVEETLGWLIITVFLAASLWIERAWCRFLCPLGAFTGTIGWLSAFKIERSSACIRCHKCDAVCPAGVVVSEVQRMQDSRCLKCMQCLAECPTEALSLASPRLWHKRITPVTAGLVAVLLFVSILGGAQLSGNWNAKSPGIKAATQIKQTNEIKGWMIWAEVAAAFGIEEKALLLELGLPEDLERQKTIKAIKSEYGISENKVRQAVEKLRKK